MATLQPTIQIGKHKLNPGIARWVARPIALGLLVWIAYLVPPLTYWPMWVSAAGWFAFSVYWSAAARNSAEARSSESTQSRRVHMILTNVGQLLLFLSVPGLRQFLLPASSWWVAAGLALQ